ncbi:MAG TPA: glycosyltransferase family A protein [Anaerolineales bacterium]
MRVGHNPARFVEKVAQPAEITVAVVNCIPFLSGYYEQSLDVLKACITSIHENTPEPHDLMVFDNHSCHEVRAYLENAYEQGIIQYLVLSDKNIGKIGAWNFMFGAAQGKYVVFSDGDIGFRPGWLPVTMKIFETFPKVGMVTARPLRTPMEYSTATLEWAKQLPSGVYEEGHFLDWETYREHIISLGLTEEQAQADYPGGTEHRLHYQGQTAYIGSTHFQFMAPREVLQKIIPLPSEQPMRGERALDAAINKMGLLRLTTDKPLVWHMGNRLSIAVEATVTPKRKSLLHWLLWLPMVRRILLWLNNQIFRLYFLNVE